MTGANMFLLPRNLAFTSGGFRVHYQPSPSPQLVAIDVGLRKPSAVLPSLVAEVVDFLSEGVGASSVFPPAASWGRLVDAQEHVAADGATSARFILEVGGVAPIFLRNLVDHLASAGEEEPLSYLGVTGQLPDDGTRSVVTSATLERWLASPLAFPEETPHPGFVVTQSGAPRGAAFRCVVAGTIDEALFDRLHGLAVLWAVALRWYPGPAPIRAPVPFPKVAHNGVEFRAYYQHFGRVPALSRAVLVNMLSHLAGTTTPIASLDLRL